MFMQPARSRRFMKNLHRRSLTPDQNRADQDANLIDFKYGSQSSKSALLHALLP